MGRYFENERDYISALQKQLAYGLECRSFIQNLWPDAESDVHWSDGKQLFEVTLRKYGHVWGKAENEHDAWILAKKALADWDVLLAFPENGQN